MSCCPFCPLIEANVQVCNLRLTRSKTGKSYKASHTDNKLSVKNKNFTRHIITIFKDLFEKHIRVGGELGLGDEREERYGCRCYVRRLSQRTYEMCFHVVDKNTKHDEESESESEDEVLEFRNWLDTDTDKPTGKTLYITVREAEALLPEYDDDKFYKLTTFGSKQSQFTIFFNREFFDSRAV